MSNLIFSSLKFVCVILIKLEEEYHHNHQQYHIYRSKICEKVQKILSYDVRSSLFKYAGGMTVFMIACLYYPFNTMFRKPPSIELIRLLLDAKANPNTQDLKGNTVLHCIAKEICLPNQQQHVDAWVEVVKLLLANGAHLDVANSTGQTFTSMQRVITVNFVTHTSLKCLAATTIRKYQSDGYIFDVPDMFRDFIDIHYKYIG